MSAYRDDPLAARFAALAPEPLPADWLDVQRRLRRKGRRRTLTLLVAAALAVIVVGSAVAVGPRVVDLIFSEQAPKAQARFIAVDLVNSLADMSAVAVYTRPIRIDDPEAAKQGLEPPYGWTLYRERLSRGNEYTMTPWAGRYEIAFAPVGQPVSEAVARATFEVAPGASLVVAAAGLAGSGEARVVVRDDRADTARRGKALVRVWGLLPGTPPLKVEVAPAEPPFTSCRQPSTGWVTLATDLRFGETARLASLTPGTYHVRVTANGKPVVDGFLEAPYPQDAMPGSPPLVGESFVTGVARSDGVRPAIDQARYYVHYPSDC